MPIDTSIALGVRPPQFQTIDPMTIYSAMENQRINALREQALQQDMQRNALIMQNTMEDRRAAAAKAAQERAQAAEFSRILQGGYKPPKNAIMGPGTIQGSTPASFDESSVLNALYAKGNPAMLTAYSNMQEQIAKQREAEAKATGQGLANVKTRAETSGVLTDNQKKLAELADVELKQISTGIDRAPSIEAVNMLYDANPNALAVTGKTPEQAKTIFAQRVAEVGFDRARMEVAQGVFATAKQLSEIATAQKPEIMTDANGNLISANAYTATATPFRMAAPAGAPAAGAPAAAGEPVKAAPKGGLTENQKMQLKARTSDDFGMATETLRYVQDIERDIKSLTDADIGGATGYQSYLPSFKTDTIRAEKTLTELRDKVGALGRTLASMSGKLGNLAVQEYEFLRQQVALIDPTAGEKDVKRQLAKAETSMKRIANTVRDRYSREYGGEDNPFPQFRELPKEVGAETKSGAANKSGTTSSGISYSIED